MVTHVSADLDTEEMLQSIVSVSKPLQQYFIARNLTSCSLCKILMSVTRTVIGVAYPVSVWIHQETMYATVFLDMMVMDSHVQVWRLYLAIMCERNYILCWLNIGWPVWMTCVILIAISTKYQNLSLSVKNVGLTGRNNMFYCRCWWMSTKCQLMQFPGSLY